MKQTHFILIAFFAFAFLSCEKKDSLDTRAVIPSNDSSNAVTKSQIVDINSNIVNYEESCFIVNLLFHNNEIMNVIPVETACGVAARIYNFRKGWVVIAGDKRMSPVLGSNMEESFMPHECSNNGMLIWLDMIKEEYEALQSEPAKEYKTKYSDFWDGFASTIYIDENYKDFFIETKDPNTMYYWRKEYQYSYYGTTYDTMIKNHLVSTKWGQDYPWNDGFPYMVYGGGAGNCPAGCVAVAMGQIMKYYHDNMNFSIGLHHDVSYTMPNDTTVNILLGNYQNNSTRWSQMAMGYPGSVTSYVRDLLLEIGGIVGMTYRPTGSAAIDNPSKYALFNINCTETPYYDREIFFDIIYPQLMLDQPIHVKARRQVDSTTTRGHSWIIDGALYSTTQVFNVYKWVRYVMPNEPGTFPIGDHIIDDPAPGGGGPGNNHEFDHEPGEVVVEEHDLYTYYLLMNWGYDGYGDVGHYSIETSGAWQIWDRNYLLERAIIYGFNQNML